MWHSSPPVRHYADGPAAARGCAWADRVARWCGWSIGIGGWPALLVTPGPRALPWRPWPAYEGKVVDQALAKVGGLGLTGDVLERAASLCYDAAAHRWEELREARREG